MRAAGKIAAARTFHAHTRAVATDTRAAATPQKKKQTAENRFRSKG